MSIDLCTELARKEYVEKINEINNKYKLPFIVIETLLNDILTEVKEIRKMNVENELKITKEQQDKNKQDKKTSKQKEVTHNE